MNLRVTQNMLSNNMLRNINKSYRSMEKMNSEIASGRRINRPSDDPVGAMRSMQYRTQLFEIDTFKRNVSEARGWMDTADGLMSESGEVLRRVKELLVQASNDILDPIDRKAIAEEITHLKDNLGEIANTSLNGRYLYSGSKTGDKPYVDGRLNSEIAYQSSAAVTSPDPFMNKDLSQINFNVEKLVLDGQTIAINWSNELSADEKILFSGDYSATSATPEQQKQVMEVMERVVNVSIQKYNNQNASNVEPIHIDKDSTGSKLVISSSAKGEASQLAIGKDGVLGAFFGQSSAQGIKMDSMSTEISRGNYLQTNVSGEKLFGFQGGIFNMLDKVAEDLKDPTKKGNELSSHITTLDAQIEHFATMQSELGARANRLENAEYRLAEQEEYISRLLSENEDTDLAKAITELTAQENVHKAALGSGARIIQQTLMDYLR